MRQLKFVRYSSYTKYLVASAADTQMASMVEASNTYRTILTLLLTIVTSIVMNSIANHIRLDQNMRELGLVFGAALLFLFSFRKQSDYVSRRVEHYGGGQTP